LRIIQKEFVKISKNSCSDDKEYIKIKKPKNKNWSNKKMNDIQQGVIAVALIAFFIIVAIVVNTPALTGTSLIQFPDQEEIIIENETASNNTTAMNNTSNNTE
jgi:hypothetical protein